MDVVDLAFVCGLARAHGIVTVVDNAFATAALQRPLEFGADVVAYSRDQADGRAGPGARRRGVRQRASSSTTSCCRSSATPGPNLSPFNAWVVLKGLETLDLRAHRQSENALDGRPVRRRPGAARCSTRACRAIRSTTWRCGRWTRPGRSSRFDARRRARAGARAARRARADRHLEQHRRFHAR